MANGEHLRLLKTSVKAWNLWRERNRRGRRRTTPDLYRAELYGVKKVGVDFSAANLGEGTFLNCDFSEANFRRAYLEASDLSHSNLQGSNFWRANLEKANLTGASLKGATLSLANLTKADLSGADLRGANLASACLRGANLWRANLKGANLRNANLKLTQLISTVLVEADLTGAHVYGASVWGVDTAGAQETGLRITRRKQPVLTVDNLDVAQFLYLMIDNQRLRAVIENVASKIVLILGRFTPERKSVLDAIKAKLRESNYTPVLFDFEPSDARDLTETIGMIAHMSRFVIADITDAKSIPQELATIVPHLPSVPVQPLLEDGKDAYGMFEHFKRYPWVLDIVRYASSEDLLARMDSEVLGVIERTLLA